MPSFEHQKLIAWFLNEKRDLPWRGHPTPYQVWVSEVMLQQTQVSVVIPYFLRWMQLFPSIQDLAQAPHDEVLKAWEGLGYYSRARNLHEGAKYVVDHFHGILPDDPVALDNIKGLGPYTIGAIRSFAFHKRCPAVDGNVMRVLARYLGIADDIAKTQTQKKINQYAEDILPEKKPWIQVEALIELGATVCRRKPVCHKCPLKASCKAHLQGLTDTLPFKSTKTRTEYLYRAVAVIQCRSKFLIRQVQNGEIMSGLHEFPYFDTHPSGMESNELKKLLKHRFELDCKLMNLFPETTHSFTKYQVKLFPFHLECSTEASIQDFKWLTIDEMDLVAFPSGHRNIYQCIKNILDRTK